MIKSINFKIKGMQRDLSASAFNPNFAYENMNIRITPDKENTLLSITNEKGTKDCGYTLSGVPIGLALIKDTAVVFTTGDYDYIYKLSTDNNDNLSLQEIYKGDLNFDYNHPIETLVYYESDDVQKVYWTDTKNPLRVVNVADSILVEGKLPNNYKFNFVEDVDTGLSVNIIRDDSSIGIFPSGVIQYFITYYNKYGQESNIVYQSPLYFISHQDRGATSEESCNCSFNLEITNYDSTWDYLRVYSIHRTSVNSNVSAYIVKDIKLSDDNQPINITDLGNNESIGDTDLLYKNKSEMTVGSIIQKYNTLFVADINTKEFNIDSLIPETFQESGIRDGFTIVEKTRTSDYYAPTGVYPYKNSLNKSQWDLLHFKGGDIYRIGVQFQNRKGTWSNPIYIGDYTVGNYPSINTEDKSYYENLPYLEVHLTDTSIIGDLKMNGIIAMRGLIAKPLNGHKSIICQGVINPTVYNINDRVNNNIWSCSSWFFRPFANNGSIRETQNIVSRHDAPLGGAGFTNGEIQCASGTESAYYSDSYKSQILIVSVSKVIYNEGEWDEYLEYQAKVRRGNLDSSIIKSIVKATYNSAKEALDTYIGLDSGITEQQWSTGGDYTYYDTDLTSASYELAKMNGSNYFVDQNIITLNSPDINDNTYNLLKNNNWNLRIVGVIPVTANYTSYDIQQSGTLYNIGAKGEINTDFSHSNLSSMSKGLISAALWNDTPTFNSKKSPAFNFAVYPWHRSGSLGDQNSQELEDNATRYSVLEKKVIANLRYSYSTIYLRDSIIRDSDIRYNLELSSSELFNSNEDDINVLRDSNKQYIYKGNNDTIINRNISDTEDGYPIYYSDEGILPDRYSELNSSKVVYGIEPISIKYKSTIHFIGKLKDNDKHLILPSLKVSESSYYNSIVGSTLSYGIPLYDSFGYQYVVEGIVESTDGTYTFQEGDLNKFYFLHNTTSNNYILVRVTGTDSYEPIYAYTNSKYLKSDFRSMYITIGTGLTITSVSESPITSPYSQDIINGSSYFNSTELELLSNSSGILYLAELYYNNSNADLIYGDTTKESLKNLQWIINGESSILDNLDTKVSLYGDTYFSRWDCLKTYPYTSEDTNQIVEILSFMVESNINLDGRTDRNRGQSNNNNMTPSNFNLYNEVYNQEDNYFQYRIVENENSKLRSTIAWSLSKNAMEDIDTWTNIILTNSIDVDSKYGEITKLATLNNSLLFFQRNSIGQLLYNENAQITTNLGVPIELGNTGTVTGYKYISDSIGLPDKWAFCNGSSSIYFIDPYSSGIYRLTDSITDLSDNLGFRSWINTNSSKIKGWNPYNFSGFCIYYDKANSDVYIIGKDECLVYSELLGQFMSFYSYNNTPYFFNLRNRGFFLRKDGKLWEQNEGDYNSFFGELKPYWTTIIANPNPTTDKIFNTVEFRADSWNNQLLQKSTFDKLTVWNEYQHGESILENKAGKPSNLKRKFRIWRAIIPRDTISKRDRIRNTWAYIKLSKGELSNEDGIIQDTNKAILHDLSVYYYE